MKAVRLWTILSFFLGTFFFSSSALAAGTETRKFVSGLLVQSTGAIHVWVKNPEASLACASTYTLLLLPTGEKEHLYGMLLAAKTANLPVTIRFDDTCKVTEVRLGG